MQVVYSGGSTPSPSPRLQLKMGYGRPIMPGYMTHVHPQVLVQRSREKLTEGDMALRDSIPAMSTSVAFLCLLFNILLPGCGTLIAGLSVLCCSHVRPKGDTKGHCIWVNAGVALVQFVLTFLFLLGWIWSIMWGVAFLSISKQYYYRTQDGDNRQKQNNLDNAHSEIKTIPKSHPENNGCNNGNKMTERRTQNSHHDNYRLEKYHCRNLEHQLQHKRRDRLSSSESHISENNLPVTNCDTNKSDQEQFVFSNPTIYSRNREDICKTKPDHILRQPIMVLQQAPPGSEFDSFNPCPHTVPGETIMKAKTRHMKIMQRKISHNDLSPFVLTNKQLEAIVIHDLPVRVPESRRSTEPGSSSDALPKH